MKRIRRNWSRSIKSRKTTALTFALIFWRGRRLDKQASMTRHDSGGRMSIFRHLEWKSRHIIPHSPCSTNSGIQIIIIIIFVVVVFAVLMTRANFV